MPTHADPSPEIATTLLGLTETDEFGIRLASDDDLIGTVRDSQRDPPGTHFDTPGRYHLRFEASGIDFELTMQYRENDNGHPYATSLDLRLVEGYDWAIPITVSIDRITQY